MKAGFENEIVAWPIIHPANALLDISNHKEGFPQLD
jgi:hypothetical protein